MAPSSSKLTIHPWLDQPVCVQQNSIPPMETVPLQRVPKDVFVDGTHRRLLPSRTRRRLERTPKESSTRCPCHTQRGSSARIHSATPNLRNAHHIWSKFHGVHPRPIQVGKRTIRTNRHLKTFSRIWEKQSERNRSPSNISHANWSVEHVPKLRTKS